MNHDCVINAGGVYCPECMGDPRDTSMSVAAIQEATARIRATIIRATHGVREQGAAAEALTGSATASLPAPAPPDVAYDITLLGVRTDKDIEEVKAILCGEVEWMGGSWVDVKATRSD